jgi:four helix bundle protein
MPRDHRKLRVFQRADDLILRLYRDTARFPDSERFGLQSQIRRAAVSVAVNLVEGCARRSEAEYARFVDVAFASSRELQYLISIASRLAYFGSGDVPILERKVSELSAGLMQLEKSLEAFLAQRDARTGLQS